MLFKRLEHKAKDLKQAINQLQVVKIIPKVKQSSLIPLNSDYISNHKIRLKGKEFTHPDWGNLCRSSESIQRLWKPPSFD